MKNEAASEMARLRWSKKSVEERKEYSKMLVKAKRDKKIKKDA